MEELLIVEFKAGVSNLVDKKLVSDKTRGLLKLINRDGDYFIQWLSRETNTKEKEIKLKQGGIIKNIPNAPGRIFSLTNDSQRHFFWMQESSSDTDETYISTIQDIINEIEEDEKMEDVAVNLPPLQLNPVNQPLNNALPGLNIEELQRYINSFAGGSGGGNPADFSSLFGGAGGGIGGMGGGAGGMGLGLKKVSLSDIVNSETLTPLLRNLSPEEFELLKAHLPKDHSSLEDLIDMVNSPQFAQALDQFSAALRSPEVPSIFFQCELTWNPNELKGSIVETFLRAIQSKSDEKKQNKEE